MTVRELTAELASQGLEVTERYVKQILDQQRPTPQPSASGEWRPPATPMTAAEPGAPAARDRLRPVPEPNRQPPPNLEAEEAVPASGRLLTDVGWAG